MTLNTQNRCSNCNGVVRNVDGKRLTIEALTERHNDSCPGIRRASTTRKQESE
jgi:hypothetical protein